MNHVQQSYTLDGQVIVVMFGRSSRCAQTVSMEMTHCCLGGVFLLKVILLTVLIAQGHAAPMTNNPCYVPRNSMLMFDHGIVLSERSDRAIISVILSHLSHAKDLFQRIEELYAKEEFGNVTAHHAAWKSIHLPHLPQLPTFTSRNASLPEVLKHSYRTLQSYAVAMEQVVFGVAIYGYRFYREFRRAKNKLDMLVCEIQNALTEKQTLEMIENHPNSFDVEDAGPRELVYWLVVRDCLVALEYFLGILKLIRSEL